MPAAARIQRPKLGQQGLAVAISSAPTRVFERHHERIKFVHVEAARAVGIELSEEAAHLDWYIGRKRQREKNKINSREMSDSLQSLTNHYRT
jgi:hypothetical protein